MDSERSRKTRRGEGKVEERFAREIEGNERQAVYGSTAGGKTWR